MSTRVMIRRTTQRPRTTVIVPTVGKSRYLRPCLEALRRTGGDELEILLVAQGMDGLLACDEVFRLADRGVYLSANVGFAVANNHGLALARGELVATVNDDVIVEDDWYEVLVQALAAAPEAAAVQGVNLTLAEPRRIDGCGLAWNDRWQAVQIGHGEEPPGLDLPPREVFGVSATAAIYRRAALDAVSHRRFGDDGLPVFDSRLYSYYEDVDLACRLRAHGFGARLVPAARAVHAGSATGKQLTLGSWPLVYGNRYLVLARLCGRSFYPWLPRLWWRDVLDLGRALSRGEVGRMAGIAMGWARAALLMRRFVHGGRPLLPRAVLGLGLGGQGLET